MFDALVWLEPDLRDAGGHFLDLARAMRAAANELGLDAVVVGSREAHETIGDLTVVPALDRMSARHAPRWAGGYVIDPLLASRRIETQLRERVTPLCGPRTLVIASSANHRHYRALGSWLDGFADTEAPALALMLRVSELDAARGRRRPTAVLTRRGLRGLGRTSTRRSVRLLTDSEELAREYGELTPLPIAVVPTPYLVPAALEAPSPDPGRPLRLGFFGQARGEKGFPALVDAVDRLAASGRLDKLALTVQCYVRPGYEDQVALDSSSALAATARLLTEMLAPDQYVAELAACDAVLLPYSAERYRSRTSGVFVDALAAGRPVVTTKGSWMSRQLDRHGAGVTYDGGTGEALADAIEELRKRWPELRSAAAASAAAWRTGRHPRDMLEAVVRLFA